MPPKRQNTCKANFWQSNKNCMLYRKSSSKHNLFIQKLFSVKWSLFGYYLNQFAITH